MMTRLRVTCTTAALLIALAALTLNSLAQPPGRGGGGGGGGGGRGGPGGGFGGFGGFGGRGGPGGPGGNSLLELASNPAVQEELKLKDKQKAQIKSLKDKYDAQSQELRGQMGGPGGQGRGGAQGKGQFGGQNGFGGGQGGGGGFGGGGDAVGGGGFGGGGGGGQGQDPNAQGGGGGGGRRNRNQNGQGAQPQEDPEVAQQRREQREMAFAAMTELRQSAETTLGKILDKAQVTRLKQIDLQRQGPDVVFRPDMIEKLNIDEAQVEMLNEVRGGRREAQQVTRRARGEMMKAAFATLNPQGNNGGNDANGANGQNGNRRARGPDPAMREAMQKYMERPEVKAQEEQIKAQDDKITSQYAAAINKVLTPRQRALFKKMLGAPFDLAKLNGGNPWGWRGGNVPGSQAATKGGANGASKTASTAKSTTDDDDADDASTAKATTAAPTKAKAAAPKRKSLRELRGAAPAPDDN